MGKCPTVARGGGGWAPLELIDALPCLWLGLHYEDWFLHFGLPANRIKNVVQSKLTYTVKLQSILKPIAINNENMEKKLLSDGSPSDLVSTHSCVNINFMVINFEFLNAGLVNFLSCTRCLWSDIFQTEHEFFRCVIERKNRLSCKNSVPNSPHKMAN